MNHIVLGNGNLAQSIIKEIIEIGDSHSHHYRGNGFNYPVCLKSYNFGITDNEDYYVWNTIGAGSIAEADNDFRSTALAHICLPAELEQSLPENTTIINFSSDYAAYPELSRYALSKSTMENYINKFSRKNVFCIRVSNLYGVHNYKNTLPYKLFTNKEKIRELPENIIAPTPTEWLAKELLSIDWKELEKKSINNKTWFMAPIGISVREFGEIIFGKKLKSSGFDKSRPLNYYMGSDFGKAYVDQLWERSDLKKLLI